MFAVNLVVIYGKMKHTPLDFLRQDLKKRNRRKAIRLPRWKFFRRFRIRIIFQNIPNYLILFFGIFFVMVMLAMAIGMPNTLDYYKENTSTMMFADYQYVLKSCNDENGNLIATSNAAAEKFGMKSLQRKKQYNQRGYFGIRHSGRQPLCSDRWFGQSEKRRNLHFKLIPR